MGGVTMTGLALTVSAFADLLIVGAITRVRYGIRLKRRALTVFSVQLPMILASWILFTYVEGWWRWIAGIALFAVSTVYSLYYLKKDTAFIRNVSDRIKRKLNR
jgi:hypothetical protein